MPEAESSHIHAHDVWRRYGRGKRTFDAVRGVSFTVRPGQLFALLGTNGAGKTSTVELLEGLAAPYRGRVRLFGDLDPVADRARIRPRTGAMLQEGGFVSHLTVRESVEMWAELTSRPRPVAQALELAGLSHRRDVMVQNLSGGERRRLDLAVATLSRPEVLFLDEPTAGMDAEGRHATWRLIGELRERGSTILLTTHYLEEAESLADRLAIMHRGRIAASGTVAEIVADHPSTLSFGLDDRWTVRDLPIGGTSLEERGGRVTITTGQLQKDAARLLAWAEEKGVELERFTARPASLEEAFIGIAGRDGFDDRGDRDDQGDRGDQDDRGGRDGEALAGIGAKQGEEA
ncbi:ABC transporter ATP-binding protein [Streptomyces fenghuangensis]|uniref:ABC transporter ATP-binding protein n=1 Tax=Streptomyces sp. ICN903 TaxID=2964654 RepID=UPI001EDA3930|nr:ABC transporter ATP-binding protein [Streptomyces sp. ICN903]MCG3040334.1 ABC transporter ATP-binding protein [Streptomyces sp. ICN903]